MESFFIESLDLREHPIIKAKMKIRVEYLSVLSYIVSKVVDSPEKKIYSSARLNVYQKMFGSNALISKICEDDVKSFISKPWRKKYRYMLACDVHLVLIDETLISGALTIINRCLSGRGQMDVSLVVAALSSENDIEKKHFIVAPLINQYRINMQFFSKTERRIIVTANMSAGKSTLINALIGKPVVRTSQEVCTGNVCYLLNKAFEDDNVHLLAKMLTLNASIDDLHNYEWSDPISIATYFAWGTPQIPRLCFIDTPGVNAALYKNHTDITHTVLLNEKYDMVLYVVCPTNLGTDAEIKHLKWVVKNIPKEKIIFVLNKLDNYRDCADSIDESVQSLKTDLIKLGFEKPIICPISAYFAYLLKLKETGQKLSDDEMDEYAYLSKKFMRDSYDLSRYYEDSQTAKNESKEMKLNKRTGMCGLEKIIYGG